MLHLLIQLLNRYITIIKTGVVPVFLEGENINESGIWKNLCDSWS